MINNKKIFKVFIKPHKAIYILLELYKKMNNLYVNPFMIIFYIIEALLDRRFLLELKTKLSKAKKDFNDERLGGWIDLELEALILYSMIRYVKPEIIIETGVGPGGSSAVILNAIMKNKKGYLYSIDLPGFDAIYYPKIGKLYNIHVPPGYKVGWLVPDYLKKNWTLILGDSKEKLPELLSNLKKVDMFLHDSLHTDEHVFFELSTIIPKLSRDGWILADDVNEYWSLEFINFCKNNDFKYEVFFNRLGLGRKIN